MISAPQKAPEKQFSRDRPERNHPRALYQRKTLFISVFAIHFTTLVLPRLGASFPCSSLAAIDNSRFGRCNVGLTIPWHAQQMDWKK